MKHVMQHDLEPALAKKAAEMAFTAYAQKYAAYHPRLVWKTETRAEVTFHAKGINVRGDIELLPKAISFDLEVPFVLRLFKNKAIEVMDRELRVWVDKAKRGEL
jgi:hypothetical protein